MEKESRKRVVLKLGAVFTAGLLLFIVRFGAGSLWEMLFFTALPFMTWKAFIRDRFLVVGSALTVLMLVSVGACIWSRRLLWIAYVLIAAHWLWTFALMTLSI